MKIEYIQLFLGDERYLIENKIKRLIKEAKVDEYNITYYDMEEVSLNDALNDALTPPFMSDKKVIVLKNPYFITSEKTLDAAEKKKFQDYIARPMESTLFIINGCGLKPDERKTEVKKLMSGNFVNYSKELSEIEIYGWIKRQASLHNIMFVDDAVRYFYRLVGNNLMNAKNELDKLFAYVGENGNVTTEVVKKVVIKELQNDVYALSNAIIAQNKIKALNIYGDLIKLGNDANYLFNLISKSMRELLAVNIMLQQGYHQAKVASTMGVSSKRAYFMVKNARTLDFKIVKKYVTRLGDLDYKIKSGQTDVKTGLEFFLFNI